MLGARGSSALVAEVDFNLEIVDHNEVKKRKIKGVSPGQLAVITPKARDANKSGMHRFKLEEIVLGTNKWGNPVTSMVVTPIMPPDGAAFDKVEIADEEPKATDDELTSDQNRKAEEKRQELLADVREAMRKIAKLVNGDMQATLAEIERAVPKLGRLKRDSGDNYARELKKLLFRGEAAELLDDGWLRYQAGSGRRVSCLIFSPKR
jgi:hypothetical protein